MAPASALPPGAIDAMFGAIKAGRFAQFAPRIVREPPFAPWVAVFDDFLSDAECEGIIDAATGFQRSTDKGGYDAFGGMEQITTPDRTSRNAWCDDDACDNDPSVVAVKRKIQNVTGVSQENYEHLQILRYEKGQFYRTHHDMQPGENDMAAGPRVLTFFLYLSDVEEGGETNFPRLDDLDVRPRKGRALLWPSVLSNDPTLRDERTFHQAKDVLKGVKYAANAWIHAYSYRLQNLWGCSGVSMTQMTSVACE